MILPAARGDCLYVTPPNSLTHISLTGMETLCGKRVPREWKFEFRFEGEAIRDFTNLAEGGALNGNACVKCGDLLRPKIREDYPLVTCKNDYADEPCGDRLCPIHGWDS